MSFDTFLSDVEHPSLRAVAIHWNAARGAKTMPAWSDIDPVAIAPYLPIVWSWKYDRAGDAFAGRLAGTEIELTFGKSLRGVPMREFFEDWDYETIFERHRRVAVEPALAHGRGLVFKHAGQYGLGERIIMPLSDDGRHGDGIIGATVYRLGFAVTGAAAEEPQQEIVTFYSL